jgi:uncharacterized membrane protein YGL010W
MDRHRTYSGLITLALLIVVAWAAASLAAHIFSPWLLVAVGILLFIKFRPRRRSER